MMNKEHSTFSFESEKRVVIISSLISVAFLVVAILLAHKHNRKFWGYVGYILLAGVVSTPLNYAVIAASISEKAMFSTSDLET